MIRPASRPRPLRLLRDDDLRERTGAAARACVEADYRWDLQLQRLDRVLEAVTARRPAEPDVTAGKRARDWFRMVQIFESWRRLEDAREHPLRLS